MTKPAFKRIGRCALMGVVAISLIGMMTGCKSGSMRWNPFKSKHPPLMDGRGVIPPAYSEPSDASFAPTTPVEPMIDVPLTGPGSLTEPLDELAVAPVDPEPAVSLPTIDLPPVVETSTLTYEVKKGDSLWKIARMYGITHQELAAYNKLDMNGLLKVGTVLAIPPGGKFVPQSERPSVRPAPTTASTTGTVSLTPSGSRKLQPDGTYRVKSGDNLWLIARDFNTKVSAIRRENNLTSDTLQVDQILKIPGPGAANASTTNPSPVTVTPDPVDDDNGTAGTGGDTMETGTGTGTPAPVPPPTELPNTLDYTVTEGDSLQNIADMFSIDVNDIIQANPAVKTDADLRPNMNIKIPLD